MTRGLKPYWSTYATYYDGDYWAPATEMPFSRDRISSTMSGAPALNGQFWVVWHTDDREENQITVPRNNQVWACVLTPSTPVPVSKLATAAPEGPVAAAGHADEPGDVKRIRGHTVTIGNRQHRIYRGDLHRHTEFSTDSGGAGDGSVPDFFRYMIDAASMDFGAVTDHSAGGDNEYWWWLTQKLTEMHQAPGRYLALFGNERSVTFPNGHRNTLHAERNVPAIKFYFKSTMPEAYNTSEASSRDLADNDTKLLYTELRRTRGIAISHTSAAFWGTDWRDNDPEVEPVVEIFQGLRNSYEHERAPASQDPNNPAVLPRGFDGHYQPAGFVWNAWAKGYRLGVIASSDHSSTHLSYALLYSAEPTRAGLLEAMRKRHTYAATDNILLEYWMGDHFMGDEFTTDRLPELKVKARGTAPVAKVSIIRSNQYISQQQPNTPNVDFTFRDTSPLKGASYYYVRVEQADGQMAWSSPIWVNLR